MSRPKVKPMRPAPLVNIHRELYGKWSFQVGKPIKRPSWLKTPRPQRR
jgi:hypothetical protein